MRNKIVGFMIYLLVGVMTTTALVVLTLAYLLALEFHDRL